MFSAELIQLLDRVQSLAHEIGARVYVVGGFVRDLLISGDTHDQDLDLVADGDGRPLAAHLNQALGGSLRIYPAFFTAKITKIEGYGRVTEIDVASARSEVYKTPGELPVVSIATISDDLKRRDFTVNAMAINLADLNVWLRAHAGDRAALNGHILDHFGGKNDLASRLIRVLHDRSFLDDPTRVFRAYRYFVRLSGDFDRATAELLHSAISGGALSTISNSRKLTEVRKICWEDATGHIVEQLAEAGVFEEFPLFERGQRQEVCSVLKRLDEIGPFTDPDLKFETCLRIFYRHAGSERAALLKRCGVAKKRIAQIELDLGKALDGSAPAGLTDLELMLAWLFAPSPGNREESLGEIRRRRLV